MELPEKSDNNSSRSEDTESKIPSSKTILKAKIESIVEKERKLKNANLNDENKKKRKEAKKEIGEFLNNLDRPEVELKVSKKTLKLEKKLDIKRHNLEQSYTIIYELWGEDACFEIGKIIEKLKDDKRFQKRKVKIQKSNKILLNL